MATTRVSLLRPDDEPGQSAILVIPIPEPYASQYAGFGREGQDDSPPHVTVLYLGPTDPPRFEELEAIGAGEAGATDPMVLEFTPGIEYFDTPKHLIACKGFTVESTDWLRGLHERLRQHCTEAGFEIKHVDGFKAHSTLGYLALDADRAAFEAEHPSVPEGSFVVEDIQLWGTQHDTPTFQLGTYRSPNRGPRST